MTKSILNDCLSLKSEPTEKLQEYFQSIGLTIFDDILSRQPIPGEEINTIHKEEPKLTILYILTAYSEDSPLVILKQDAKEEKNNICEYLQVPEFMRYNLTNLVDPMVRKATTQYLSQFAGPLFKSLMFMKIQYDALELDITNRAFTIKKSEEKDSVITTTEVYDSKEHGKAVTELARLAKAISLLEKEIRDKSTYKAIEDLKDWAHHGSGKFAKKRTGSVENQVK